MSMTKGNIIARYRDELLGYEDYCHVWLLPGGRPPVRRPRQPQVFAEV